MAFKQVTYLEQFVVSAGQGLFHRGLALDRTTFRHGLRGPDPGHNVLTLSVNQVFTVENVFTGGGVAGKAHTCCAVIPHVAEHHGLYVNSGAPACGNIVQFAIGVGAWVHP